MAHLALPVHAASFAISTTSSPAATKADRSLLSFFRWIAADDLITLLMSIHGVVLQFKLVLCGSCLSDALTPVTAMLADLEQHQVCIVLHVWVASRDVLLVL